MVKSIFDRPRPPRLFRLCGRLSLRHGNHASRAGVLPKSLPLMRKTFIEASSTATHGHNPAASLPLMRKTFIEATATRSALNYSPYGSLPLMRKTFIEAPQGAVMAAFNAQGLFRLCGRLSLRWGKSPRVRRILLFPPLLWRLSLRAGGVRIYPQLWFSAAYIADFHF